ncbi:NADH dehydrogenase [ubiquinone] 1 alpha subcomplex assembly factor 2 isoform X1 [Nannospalax galili]|uniref:NADH dehydrogenase [ubiquinone] 1 alpha subcomplex assembly factor 2 isoform X1 n=1 Tax=Nannospalax galili TaxID=1026970 RepID=UPI0004ED1D40|nr:NADH dehydrogenase [ubiquinone] 1 alpha subcomplex assembly factor 2 isoform X1 [Nannospalax galili]
MGWSGGVLRTLWSALSREVKQHVGTDQLGNKYYYIAEYKNWRESKLSASSMRAKFCSTKLGQTIREKRIVETANKKELDYEVGDIPTEWEAWIRRTRKTPPTMEEILKNEKYREEMKIKSKEFYEKDKLSKETSEELLPSPVATQIKGHASSPDFGKEEHSVAPTSTGKTFQPGSWMPQDGKRHNQ